VSNDWELARYAAYGARFWRLHFWPK